MENNHNLGPESSSPHEEEVEAQPEWEFGKQGDGLDVEFSSPYVPEPLHYNLPASEIMPPYVHSPFGRRIYDRGPVDPPEQGRRHGAHHRLSDHQFPPAE